MPSAHFTIDGHNLTLEQLEVIARQDVEVSLDPAARRRVQASAELLSRLSAETSPIYGVNTGYGVFSDRRIDEKEASALSRNLILSHAVCVGVPLPRDVTRAAMVIRANALAHGLSGVRPILIDTLLEMLSRGVTPVIPSQGSLGSSGDLGPLAHLALVVTAADEGPDNASSGWAWYQDETLTGAEAMRRAGISRVQPGPKDGLAMTNGASFCAAMLALACVDAVRTLSAAEAAAAMSFEALRGVQAALDPRLHQARPHPGQAAVAGRLSSMVSGSSLIDSSSRVQDAYSLRCIPQVLGPIWETLEHATAVARIEVNSATDNPLLFDDGAISGGNFHGEPVGMACDFLKIALCNAGGIAERRVFRLVSEHTSDGLPPMLVSSPEAAGLQSGLMMLQYTAASLALENQALATPDSVRSLPTSADQEDFNANATTAAHNLMRVSENVRQIVAIELVTASRALDMRRQESPSIRFGAGTSAVHSRLRSEVPLVLEDHVMADEIQAAAAMISSGRLMEGIGQPA